MAMDEKIKKQTKNRVAIAGQVRDKETQLPIPGVLVEISQESGKFKNWLTLHKLQYGENWEKMLKRPDRTLTAIDGYFYFINLPDGKYTLTVSLPGTGTRYGSIKQEVQVSHDSDSIKLSFVDVALPPTAIKGQITDSQKELKPVVMAKVQVEGRGESTFSDSKGNYLLNGIEATKTQCAVKVSAQGYQQASKDIHLKQGEMQALNFEERK